MPIINSEQKSAKKKAYAPFSAPSLAEPHKPAKIIKSPIKPARIKITISHIRRHLISEIGINIVLPISMVRAGRAGMM